MFIIILATQINKLYCSHSCVHMNILNNLVQIQSQLKTRNCQCRPRRITEIKHSKNCAEKTDFYIMKNILHKVYIWYVHVYHTSILWVIILWELKICTVEFQIQTGSVYKRLLFYKRTSARTSNTSLLRCTCILWPTMCPNIYARDHWPCV